MLSCSVFMPYGVDKGVSRINFKHIINLEILFQCTKQRIYANQKSPWQFGLFKIPEKLGFLLQCKGLFQVILSTHTAIKSYWCPLKQNINNVFYINSSPGKERSKAQAVAIIFLFPKILCPPWARKSFSLLGPNVLRSSLIYLLYLFKLTTQKSNKPFSRPP